MENKNIKKRPEHLTTTIGDLMKLQGNDILKTEKKPYKKNKKYKKNFNNKKENDTVQVNDSLKKAIDDAVEKGVLRNDDLIKFDMRTSEQIEKDTYKDGVVIKDGSMEELAAAFLAEPEKEGPKINSDSEPKAKFVINSDYITKEGTDARVRTDEFIKK